ncbi:putative Phage integrase family protein [Bradyrhizobium sp. STM 3843]|nr:putative Phage integrase family protein [Bradyrhizobium sp. STM 3843]
MKLPHGCKRYVDHTGVVRTYYRHTSPPTPLPGLPWSPEFMAAYEAAKARGDRVGPVIIGASRTMPGTVNAALVKYYSSDEFKNMTKDVRQQNRGYLEKWRATRGDKKLRGWKHEHVQGFIGKLTTPYAQRNNLRALRHFARWAKRERLLDVDPTTDIEKAKIVKTGGFRVWTEAEFKTYVAKHPIGTKAYLALQIMACTSFRRSDAVQIGPRHVRKTAAHPLGVIEDYQPQKGRRTGGNLVTVPIHPDLAAAIEAMSMVGADTFLVTDYGKAFTPKGLGAKMREWCDAAGVPPMVDAAGKSKNVASHGLRKLCLTRLAEAGCTVFEIASISGHKDLREVQLYVEAANRKKMAAAAMGKLEEAQSRNVICLNREDI